MGFWDNEIYISPSSSCNPWIDGPLNYNHTNRNERDIFAAIRAISKLIIDLS